ncbi:MAG TPA: hypothetical protein VMS60_15740 [Solirubrobacterales bacterium]|nr:hypothetical protein [Solirubrobacterales bacterium]
MPERRDIAALAAEVAPTERESWIEANLYLSEQLIATVQAAGGTIDLPGDWQDQIQGKVVFSDPMPGGGWRLTVVDRIEELSEREIGKLDRALGVHRARAAKVPPPPPRRKSKRRRGRGRRSR